MSVDLAKLVVSVDTKDLDQGVASLNKFSTTSKTASSSAKQIGDSITSASKVFAQAILGMNKGILSLVSSMGNASTSQKKLAAEAVVYSKNLITQITANEKLVASQTKVTAAQEKTYASLKKLTAGMKSYSSGIGIMSGTDTLIPGSTGGQTATDKQTNRFYTGNIAAQFQDIGVTAAMGMSPLMIALQQGTQISAVLEGMRDSAGKTTSVMGMLGDAFKSIISPLSLMTIGLIAGGVALIQWVDWGKIGQSVMGGLSSTFKVLAENADIVAVALASATLALIAFKGAAMLAGVVTVVTVLTTGFLKLLTVVKTLGVAIALMAKPLLLVVAAGAGVISFLEGVLNIPIVKWFEDAFDSMSKWFDSFFKQTSKMKKEFEEFSKISNEFNIDLFKSRLDMEFERDMIGKTADEMYRLRKEREIFDEALKTGIFDYKSYMDSGEYTEEQAKAQVESFTKAYREEAKVMADIFKETERLKSLSDVKVETQTNLADLLLEKELIGLTAHEVSKLRMETELLGQLKFAKPEDLALVKQLSEEYAKQKTEVEHLNDVFETGKDVTKGFFQTIKDGLMEGKNLWESFGDAVLNVLNKMLDRFLDIGVDALFSGGKSATGGNSGSFMTFLSSVLGGNMFAKGGAFTNGVYDSPTMFKFAKGGSFGVMGEAGPEAVMPLHRGSDGSLGVRMEGGSSSGVVVNVVNNAGVETSITERQTDNGIELDVMIDKAVAKNMSTPGSYSNQSVKAMANQSMIRR